MYFLFCQGKCCFAITDCDGKLLSLHQKLSIGSANSKTINECPDNISRGPDITIRRELRFWIILVPAYKMLHFAAYFSATGERKH